VPPLYILKTTSFFTLCSEAFIDYGPAPTLIVQTFARIGSDKHGESLVFFSCSAEWVRHAGRFGVGWEWEWVAIINNTLYTTLFFCWGSPKL